MIRTVLVLPSPPALLPTSSLHDPVADLRDACATAVAGLPEDAHVGVVAPPVGEANVARGVTVPLGHRVAAVLLAERPFEPLLAVPGTAAALQEPSAPAVLLVMADGSARRAVKAPGHVHPDALAFDARIDAALRTGDAETLATLDPRLGDELWSEGVPGLRVLGELARGRRVTAEVSYAEAPHGVAWWVARWDLR